MELLEKLRAAVRELRPSDAPRTLVEGGSTPDRRAAVEFEDIEALARSTYRRGFRVGADAVRDGMQVAMEAQRRAVALEAETRGALAGLDVAIAALFEAIEANEGRNESLHARRVHDSLATVRAKVAEEGMHGERLPRAGMNTREVMG